MKLSYLPYSGKLLHRLDREVWFRAVVNCNAAAVSAWRVRRDDAIAGRPAGVDSIGKFGFLEDAQVNIGP